LSDNLGFKAIELIKERSPFSNLLSLSTFI